MFEDNYAIAVKKGNTQLLNKINEVIDNLKNATTDEVFKTIEDATTTKEEKVLPGLGVLFEVLWKSSDASFKETLATKVTQNLN